MLHHTILSLPVEKITHYIYDLPLNSTFWKIIGNSVCVVWKN